MDQVEDRRNIILLAIITLIVLYVAFSVYWIIRDIGTGQTVFVISSDIPQVGQVERVIPFWQKIKEFFLPAGEVIVPVKKIITLEGRVVYTNGHPFANGRVELHSNPRYTYTDSDGYFKFEDIEDREHKIYVLGGNNQILASAVIVINRDMEIDEILVVELDDGTIVLHIPLDVKLLEILLEIEQGADGEPTGRLNVHLDPRALESAPPQEDGGIPGEGDKPAVPVDPPVPGDPIIGGGGLAPEPPAGTPVKVYSTEDVKKLFSEGAGQKADINIFGNKKHIAPGMSGIYRFTIDNTGNDFGIYYAVDIIETGNRLNIPMRYRLYNEKTRNYVNGDDKWHPFKEISEVTASNRLPFTIDDYGKTDYALEWLWEDNSEIDSSLGQDHPGEVVCTLTIKVSAARK